MDSVRRLYWLLPKVMVGPPPAQSDLDNSPYPLFEQRHPRRCIELAPVRAGSPGQALPIQIRSVPSTRSFCNPTPPALAAIDGQGRLAPTSRARITEWPSLWRKS